MKSVSTFKSFLFLIVLSHFGGLAWAQAGKVDLGKREFETNCVSCHGNHAKGNGPFVELLRKSPPDLTTLTKRNGGAFPVSRVYETIDATNLPSHGSRDMPIWGTDYRIKAGEYYGELEYSPEVFVRSRILALIDYLNRLQVR